MIVWINSGGCLQGAIEAPSTPRARYYCLPATNKRAMKLGRIAIEELSMASQWTTGGGGGYCGLCPFKATGQGVEWSLVSPDWSLNALEKSSVYWN